MFNFHFKHVSKKHVSVLNYGTTHMLKAVPVLMHLAEWDSCDGVPPLCSVCKLHSASIGYLKEAFSSLA